jgi:hypothetical protein
MAVLVVAVVVVLTLLSLREKPLAYDPATEATVAGTVKEVQEFWCPLSDDRGLHLVLKTDNGDVLIHIAQARFLRRQDISFRAGDKVQVLGSKVKSDTYIARQVNRGSETFFFRDPQGKPLWQ